MKKLWIALVWIAVLLTGCIQKNNVHYIDENLPGSVPEKFAEGVISKKDTSEFAGTFSNDFQYYFFTRREGGIQNRLYYTVYRNGVWTEPSLSPISENLPEFEPHISPANELYFGSMRDGHSSLVIYKSEYQEGEWQDPYFVENGLNEGFAMYVSVAENGNLYFTSEQGISMMRYDGKAYGESEFTGIEGAHSFVSQDESFILFDNSSYTDDPTKLFIAYRQEDGSFGEPIVLDETINDPEMSQICASITPDGQFLFFSRFQTGMADIYWVDAAVLENYR